MNVPSLRLQILTCLQLCRWIIHLLELPIQAAPDLHVGQPHIVQRRDFEPRIYSGFFSAGGGEGGSPMPSSCIMPGPMPPIPGPMSMCFNICSMWPTKTSHISTLLCQRPCSLGSLILATLAFICAREDFIFSMSAFMASICCLCISIIF